MSSKRKQAQDSRNTASIDKASSLELGKALGDVSSTSILVQGLFGKISEQLVTKHSELQAVNDAISLKTAELNDLHGKDKILLSIDDLNVESRIAREHAGQEIEASRRDREKEDAEYQYNLSQRRKTEDDQWKESVRLREREHKLKMEELDKKAAEREATLAAQEKAFAAAIEKLASFDEMVKKASEREAAIVGNVLKKDHTHQLEIINIQNKSVVDGLKTDNIRLQNILEHNDAIIVSLQLQLKTAQESQIQLAKDAVAGAANQKGMADMQSLITNIGGQNGTRKSS